MKSQLYTSTLPNLEIRLEFLPFSLKQINTTAFHIGDPWQNLERPSAETSHSLARSLTPALGDNLLQDDKAQGSSLPSFPSLLFTASDLPSIYLSRALSSSVVLIDRRLRAD